MRWTRPGRSQCRLPEKRCQSQSGGKISAERRSNAKKASLKDLTRATKCSGMALRTSDHGLRFARRAWPLFEQEHISYQNVNLKSDFCFCGTPSFNTNKSEYFSFPSWTLRSEPGLFETSNRRLQAHTAPAWPNPNPVSDHTFKLDHRSNSFIDRYTILVG